LEEEMRRASDLNWRAAVAELDDRLRHLVRAVEIAFEHGRVAVGNRVWQGRLPHVDRQRRQRLIRFVAGEPLTAEEEADARAAGAPEDAFDVLTPKDIPVELARLRTDAGHYLDALVQEIENRRERAQPGGGRSLEIIGQAAKHLLGLLDRLEEELPRAKNAADLAPTLDQLKRLPLTPEEPAE
jgi:hypothetical protein